MSTPATDLLTAVKALVEAALPPRKVFVRRGSDKNPVLAADMTFPCFAVSASADRPTRMAWAGKKFVRYVVELTYLTKELPGDRAASADVEAVLGAASRLFLAPRDTAGNPGLQGVGVWNDCEVRPLAPYQIPFGAQTVSASRLRLEIETVEDAN